MRNISGVVQANLISAKSYLISYAPWLQNEDPEVGKQIISNGDQRKQGYYETAPRQKQKSIQPQGPQKLIWIK